MNNIYNSKFEIGIRYLLLFYIWGKELHTDTIIGADFMCIYAKDFGLAEYNINGDSNYKYSEFTNLRNIGTDALKRLALEGLIEPSFTSDGFTYNLATDGASYVEKLKSTYAQNYLRIANKVIAYLESNSIQDITSLILKSASSSRRRDH